MNKLRYGIIGLGAQGTAYAAMLTGTGGIPGMKAAAAPDNCTVGALCDTDPTRKDFCHERYPGVPFFADWKELIQSGTVDAVITTVPHYLHTEIAIHCLKANMPVLVEKPAGVYAKEVQAMNETAAAHPQVPFGIMFNQRTNRLYQRVHDIVHSGELGSIRRSNWIINSWWRPDSYYRQSDWRATWGGEGGGVIVNQAPHQLDLWQWICGVPTRVYAKVRYGAYRDIIVDNDVTIVSEYESGATGVFVTSTHDPIGTDRFEIDLEGGKIVVDRSQRVEISRLVKPEPELNQTMDMMQLVRLTMSNSNSSELFTTEVFEDADGWGVQHLKVLVNFAAHVLDGAPLLAPGSDGLHGVNLANAALLSSWLGQEVDNPVDGDVFLGQLNQRIATEGLFPTR
jgi:UDP-N-acetyl-2-amino-2-deoxyglucuronate dehydrogenase